MIKRAIYFLPLFLLLAACAAQPSAEPIAGTQVVIFQTATPSPTATRLPFSPTPTIAPTRTPPPTLIADGELAAGDIFPAQDGGTLVFIPAGEFTMGADADDLLAVCQSFRSNCRREWFTNVEPQRTVNLDSFWIDQTEVTNKMYQACVQAESCAPPFQASSSTREKYYGNVKYDNHPVIYVSWEQAAAYCAWAGRRLPTEAEWEKAARGTDGRLFTWGDSFPASKFLNYALQEGDTTAVKAYPRGASPYGVFDMAGNAWEWVADWYDENYYKTAPSVNPQGPASGVDKVSRGGGWAYYDFDSFVTDRYGNYPLTTNNALGFRCARDR